MSILYDLSVLRAAALAAALPLRRRSGPQHTEVSLAAGEPHPVEVLEQWHDVLPAGADEVAKLRHREGPRRRDPPRDQVPDAFDGLGGKDELLTHLHELTGADQAPDQRGVEAPPELGDGRG